MPRLFVSLGRVAAVPELGQVEQDLRPQRGLQEPQGLRRLLALEPSGGAAQLLDSRVQLGISRRLQLQLEPGRAQRLVDTGEHPPQPLPPVGGEQPQPLLVPAAAELLERLAEGLASQDAALAVVEHAEARVDPGCERVGLQEPVAEAVDRRDPGSVEISGEVVALELVQAAPDPPAQLAGRALGVGDHEDRVDVEAALADGAAEPLDDDRRLAGARSGRDEDDAGLFDRPQLLEVGSFDRVHERFTRHIVQRLHHVGHGKPPFGSCLTSPSRIRATAVRARSCAASTWPQNASSSR